MYGYIYDIFLTQKQFIKEVNRIENSLTDLGLQGQIIRLSLISNVGHAVEELINRGVKTIVAVGSDQLFSSLADYADQLTSITVGLIPVGSHRLMADILGIPPGEQACQVLSARLIYYIRLGRINQKYFIHSVVAQDSRTQIHCDAQYTASATTDDAIISILNPFTQGEPVSEQIKKLTVVVTPTAKQKMFRKPLPMPSTIFTAQGISIDEPRHQPLLVDGQKIVKTPVNVTLSDQQLRVIVGKNRKL